ncbi:hypothetical protein JQC92_18080 [Shewanella sp. 202IG2-18]|uniref:hypothetical protein n=1 Tax=Parashewanella hymeniacidonis TaxID=2807618 RepID=UPI001961DE02|nr:hypothetical protein [Parashewanella hymeniacidonis]MBM7073918.1 hypothetical protein [Parashewanella hymeniacidonis]
MSIQQISMQPLKWNGYKFESLTDDQVRAIAAAAQQFTIENVGHNDNKPNAIQIPYKTSVLNRTSTITFTVSNEDSNTNDIKLSFKSFNWLGNEISTNKSTSLSNQFIKEGGIEGTLTRAKGRQHAFKSQLHLITLIH